MDGTVDDRVRQDDNENGREKRGHAHKDAEEEEASNSSVHDEPTSRDKDIQWAYLTFETDLPAPAYPSQSSSSFEGRPDPPPCPSLKPYTSPFEWSRGRKSFMTWISSVATAITAYGAGSYAPGVDQMSREWHVSHVAALVGITTFTCGFGIAPMFLAPFSEIVGRKMVFLASGALYCVMQLVCALTPTFAGMLVARFLAGCFSSTFSTMVGGVVADIYHAADRNSAMALFAGGALFGTGFGPLVSGFIAQHTTWRWIFYLQVITSGVLLVFLLAFFQETRGSVLLSRKAKALNQWYEDLESHGYYGLVFPSTTTATPYPEKPPGSEPQRIRWKVKADEERASVLTMISISLYRPFHLLCTEPTIFFFSLWASFSWGVLYLTFSAVPLIFETRHRFNTEQSGAVFAAISIGSIFSTILASYQERLARWLLPAKHDAFLRSPEGRLCACCVQSFLLPIGLFWLGWTSFAHIPWIVPTLATGCATMGIFSIYLAVFNYLADIYGSYASSALAAQSFCRNMLCGAFPLFTDQMFDGLTYQGAGSFLGGVSILLSIVPWVLVFYGPRIRARSKFARELVGNTG